MEKEFFIDDSLEEGKKESEITLDDETRFRIRETILLDFKENRERPKVNPDDNVEIDRLKDRDLVIWEKYYNNWKSFLEKLPKQPEDLTPDQKEKIIEIVGDFKNYDKGIRGSESREETSNNLRGYLFYEITSRCYYFFYLE